MFKKNPAPKQVSITDPYLSFPKYIKEALHNSWAAYFYSHIFSHIQEERFAVLYSNQYSRPNTAVNVLLGLLILKELNQWTDEEMMGAFYFDYRVQYSLGISDFEKERLCINTVGNFRSRLYEHAQEHGRDLLGEEVDALTRQLIEVSEMDTSLARQDSFMISANCKMMGRLELIYTVNFNMAKALNQNDSAKIPANCSHYLEEGDKNSYVYKIKKEDASGKIEELLKESLVLYEAVPPELKETQAFLNLKRLIEEQTEGSGGATLAKDEKEISSASLQNPSEPDATYRKKGAKQDIGYVMNAVEARDEEKEMSMIVQHELQQNIVSDVELGQNALDSDLKGVKTLANDGSYYSPETIEKADQKDIELSFSALNGRKAPENKLGADKFIIEEEEKIARCPGGFEPLSAKYDEKKQVYTARFAKEDCASCELKESCIFKERKRFHTVGFTKKKLIADTYRSYMGTTRHQNLGDFRAGTEGVPSVFRRCYRIDELPVRGLIRSQIWNHCKVMAYNFRSFYRYFKRMGVIPQAMFSLFSLFNRYFKEIMPRLTYGSA